MKLGVFIVAALCAGATTAHAELVNYSAQAAARSKARDHDAAIELYRKAYEAESDPTLLVRIAHEFRMAGDSREALAYFCSYMYVDAAGPLADEASQYARAISAQNGNPTQSDHEACAPRPPASRVEEPKVNLSAYTTVTPVIPRITKREIIGLSGLGGSLALLGLALYEGTQLKDIRATRRAANPGSDERALADREDTAAMRQKLYLVGGGALLVTSGILYVTGLNARKKAERALVAPTLTKNSAGLTVSRRF